MRSHCQTKPGKFGAVLVVAWMLCGLAGCYEHVSQGNVSIYHFAWWLGPAIIVGSILGAYLGWFLYKKAIFKRGLVLVFLAPVALLIAVPAMYRDYALVDDDHFEASYGFWFAPSVHNIRFDELREIQYVAVKNDRGDTHYELHCVGKTGQVASVSAGDLVRFTVPEILTRAQARGVTVTDTVSRHTP